MGELSKSILCGGTFFTLLLQAKRPQSPKKLGKKSDFTEADVLEKLICIVDGTFEIKEDKRDSFTTAVSDYQSCKTDGGKRVPLKGVSTVQAFKARFAKDYSGMAKKMDDIVSTYVHPDVERRIWLVKQLMELVETDASIQPNDQFYIRANGESVKKIELCNEEHICLASFLLGVWHFIIVSRPKNKLGEATYDSWHEPPETTNTKPEFISNIGSCIQIKIVLCDFIAPSADELRGINTEIPLVKPKEDVLKPNFETKVSLPLPRYKFFSGRGIYLDDLHDVFLESSPNEHTVATINGLRGMGKSRLAMEYAHENLSKYAVVVWISCTTEDAIERSCRDFFACIEGITEENAVSRFANWFHDQRNWLIIFDDVGERTDLGRLIPKMGSGHILITTHLKKSGTMYGSQITLKRMELDEAVGFLMKRAEVQDSEGASLVAKRLGCLPLALEQAAAYIKTMDSDFKQYYSLLSKHGLEALDSDDEVENYNGKVGTVWSITVENLSEPAKHLLYCFAYMSADRLELQWLVKHSIRLRNQKKEFDRYSELYERLGENKKTWVSTAFTDTLISIFTDELKRNKAIMQLIGFSLISKKTDGVYEMHGLLQEVLRMEKTSISYLLPVFEVLKTRFNDIDRLYGDFRWNTVQSGAELESIITNISALLGFREKFEQITEDDNIKGSYNRDVDLYILQFQFFSFMGQYLLRLKEYEEASLSYKKACEIATVLFGGKEGDVLSASFSFTTVQEYHRWLRATLLLDNLDEAKKIYEHVRNLLIASIKISTQSVEQALYNFYLLWKEFGCMDMADDAYKLGGENHETDLRIEAEESWRDYCEAEEAGTIPTFEEAWQGSMNQYLARLDSDD